MVGTYNVITLCGSTRFRREFEEANKRLTLAGNIVISVGLFGHAGDEEVWEGLTEGELTRTKLMLDDMHKRKIDMADQILVINPGDYLGASTRSEIAYARATHKPVLYLEPHATVLDSLAPATQADFDEVWQLFADVCEQSAHDAYTPRWTLGFHPAQEDILDYIEAGELYVGRVGERILAVLVFATRDEPDFADGDWPAFACSEGAATIHLLAVHPSLRGRHVGAELVDEALRLAYESGSRTVRLEVTADNLAASRIYAAAGFRLLGTRSTVYESTGPISFELYEYVL